MASFSGHLLLLLSLALSFGIAPLAASQQPMALQDSPDNIHISYEPAEGFEQLDLLCIGATDNSDRHEMMLSPLEYLHFVRKFPSEAYYCRAFREAYLTLWNVHGPSKSEDHSTMYWLVNLDGVFFSYDKSSWVLKSSWMTD